jgi:hypothetical protein
MACETSCLIFGQTSGAPSLDAFAAKYLNLTEESRTFRRCTFFARHLLVFCSVVFLNVSVSNNLGFLGVFWLRKRLISRFRISGFRRLFCLKNLKLLKSAEGPGGGATKKVEHFSALTAVLGQPPRQFVCESVAVRDSSESVC